MNRHLALCHTCREDLRDLEDFRADLHGTTADASGSVSFIRAVMARQATRVGLAAAGVVLAVAAARYFTGGIVSAPGSGPSSGTAPKSAIAAGTTIRDATGRIVVHHDGTIVGLPATSGDLIGAATAALRTGRLDVSSDALALSRDAGVLMGGGGGPTPAFGVSRPVGTLVTEERPTFEWTALAGARAYRVSVTDDRYHLVATSGQLTDLRWIPSRPIARGRSYVWQVEAFRGSTVTRTPLPPLPEARFHVMTAPALDALTRQLTLGSPSHLLRAIAFARAGALGDARRELQALRALNPQSSVVTALEASIALPRAR
jgi:hypothetical protein